MPAFLFLWTCRPSRPPFRLPPKLTGSLPGAKACTLSPGRIPAQSPPGFGRHPMSMSTQPRRAAGAGRGDAGADGARRRAYDRHRGRACGASAVGAGGRDPARARRRCAGGFRGAAVRPCRRRGPHPLRGGGARGHCGGDLALRRRTQAGDSEDPYRDGAAGRRSPAQERLHHRTRQRRHAVPGRFGHGRADRAGSRRPTPGASRLCRRARPCRCAGQAFDRGRSVRRGAARKRDPDSCRPHRR